MTSLFADIQELRTVLHPLRSRKKIALVPTMGNLHEGHLALVTKAKEIADIVVVSIFVNPTQFGEGEDFDNYPQTLEEDLEKLKAINTNYVFAPDIKEMYQNYPEIPETKIHLGDMTLHLCGKSRPRHFDGVGIIVSKLFNAIQPDVAIFGKKDYQQLALIRQLAIDLSYPIEIVGADIIRASDGLALSSRNQYLTEKERSIAPKIYEELTDLKKRIARGEHLIIGLAELIGQYRQKLQASDFDVDYLQVLTQQLTEASPQDKDLVILFAAWLGKARLLDNQEVKVEM